MVVESQLQMLFTPAIWRQGQLDYRQRRVNDLDYDPEERQLFGWVRGANGQEFEVQVDFAQAQGPVVQCRCQSAFCRHAAALLLQARQQLGSGLVERLLKQSGRSLLEIAEEEALRQFQQQLTPWLERLALIQETLEEPALVGEEDQLPQVMVDSGRNEFILWQLDFTQNRLLAQVVRREDEHRLGAPKRFIAASAILSGDTFPCVDELDQLLLLWSDELGLLDTEQGAIALKRGFTSHNMLRWLARCGRLYLPGQPLKMVCWDPQSLELELAWQPDERSKLKPVLLVDGVARTRWLLPGAPLLALTALDEGRYQLQPVSTALPPLALIRQLQQAPAIPLQGLPLLHQQLSDELKRLPGVRWPKAQTVRPALPQPVLKLQNDPATPRWCGAWARLEFRYANQQVSLDDPRKLLPGGDCLLQRDMALEAQFQQELSAYLGAQGRPEGTPGQRLQCWNDLLLKQVPLWRERGWTILFADDFPLQLVGFSEEDWFAELTPERNGWFEAHLGLQLDAPIDLLPLLLEQLEQLPSVQALALMPDDELVVIELGDQRQVLLSASKLRVLIDTLQQLTQGGERARASRAQLSWMLDLEETLPSGHWQMPEYDRAQAKALQQLAKEGAPKLACDQLKGVQATLRDYQSEGVAWLQFLYQYQLGGLLADDMGLGKTIQTLSHLALLKAQGALSKPAMVVAPTSLLHNWRDEAARFTPELKVLIYHGPERDQHADCLFEQDLVITSYGVVGRDSVELSLCPLSVLILDEAQAIKNPNAQVARAVRQLSAVQRLCLTGTPLENHLGELWAQFDFLIPGFFGSRQQFAKRYRQPIERELCRDTLIELRQRVAPFLLRRTKQVVAAELPAKTEINYPIHLDEAQRTLYETVRASTEVQVREWVADKGLGRSHIQVLDALTKLRQICCDPRLLNSEHGVSESAKLDELMCLLTLMLEEGRRILLFSQFTSMLSLIEERLQEEALPYVTLTGQTRDRETPVKRFQSGEVPLFLLSLKAGGTGLNLTAADVVIHYDPWWNPAVEAQATDRAYRLGQDKPVFVYRLLVEDSVEQRIEQLKARKRQLVDGLYGDDGQSQALFSEQDLDWLLAGEQEAPAKIN